MKNVLNEKLTPKLNSRHFCIKLFTRIIVFNINTIKQHQAKIKRRLFVLPQVLIWENEASRHVGPVC